MAVAAGGGRLAWNEVRLAGHTVQLDERDALHRRLTDEAARLSRLELELAEARSERERAAERSRASSAAVASIRGELGRAEAELIEAERRATKDERALAELRTRRDELDRALGQAKEESRTREEARQALAVRAEGLEQELSLARTDLQAARGRLDGLSRELAEARSATEREAARAAESQRELARAAQSARQSEELLQNLQRAGVNVDRLGGRRPLAALRGMVLRVDLQAIPPELLVDAGKDAGLEPGDRLWVVRHGRELARLEVADVRADSSTARVVQGERQSPPRPGDAVISWKPGTPEPTQK